MQGIMGFDRDQNAVKIGCSSGRLSLMVFFLFPVVWARLPGLESAGPGTQYSVFSFSIQSGALDFRRRSELPPPLGAPAFV